jgi:putative ABC transport system ATP-binding protein
VPPRRTHSRCCSGRWLRERAFTRLLERDLTFFEGRGATGNLAHRIADEAYDVKDAVLSVLNVILNS